MPKKIFITFIFALLIAITSHPFIVSSTTAINDATSYVYEEPYDDSELPEIYNF